MNLTYIIIEDNPGAIENLRIELRKYHKLKELGIATNSAEGVSLALKEVPKIIFLDIELGNENGFDILQEIKQRSLKPTCFIITTDYLKYGKEAVNRGAFYFLDKPIDPDELNVAIQKVGGYFKKQDEVLTIKNSEGHFFITLADIRYVESNNNCCTIFRDNFPPVTISRTLKDLENVLSGKFLRIHNSYIVNQKFVQMMNTSKKVLQISLKENSLTDTINLPIGNFYLDKVKGALLGG